MIRVHYNTICIVICLLMDVLYDRAIVALLTKQKILRGFFMC